MLKLSNHEYVMMKRYIEENCGIYLEENKEYLIESRLSELVLASGCKSFSDFHFKARNEKTGDLKERIVNAMTTNETSWFRDKPVWQYLDEHIIPQLIDLAASNGKVRIWSAAVSTGQEIYSLLMLLDTALKNKGMPSLIDRFELLGTDISSTALLTAVSGRYDTLSMSRGLPDDKKMIYFNNLGSGWEFNQELKKKVQFQRFNLQNPFSSLGPFDLVLCRYVSIYFSDTFKKELFGKMERVVKSGGYLVLGATETLRDFSNSFRIRYNHNVVINQKI